MASKTVAGADARPNSSHERPQEGNNTRRDSTHCGTAPEPMLVTEICHTDAILDGAQALLEPASSAQNLVDLARAQLAAVLDRLDRAGREAAQPGSEAAPATMPGLALAQGAPDAERLDLAKNAVWQAEPVLAVLLDKVAKADCDEGFLMRGLAVRVRELVDVIGEVLSFEDVDLDALHLTVHGTYRVAQGAAS